MSTAPVSRKLYHSLPWSRLVPPEKYQLPCPLPLPAQQVTLSVIQYKAFSASPITDGLFGRTSWFGIKVPFRERLGPV